MIKIFKTTIIVFTALLIASCDLNLAPENVMVDETTYKDAGTAEAALLGAYTRLNASISGAPTGVNNYANTGYALLFADLGTLTLKQRENSFMINMDSANYNSSDHDSYIMGIWRTTYNAIDYANNIIVNIEKFGDYDKELMDQHIAEAKFIRAYEYLLLLQIFGDGALTGDMDGLGVILRLKPYDGYRPEDIETRSTVGESYAQILKDLEEALPYLPNNNAGNLVARTRATRTAAHALLSRIYLYRGTYKNDVADLKLAGDYADSVINNSKNYVFSVSYLNHTSFMFPLNATGSETNSANYSDEVILLSPSYTNASSYSNGVGGTYYNKTSFFVDPDFIAIYEDGDRRGYMDPAVAPSLIWQGSQTQYPSDFTSYKYNNGGGYNNVLYLRVSEAKLTKAEVDVRLNGINSESIQHLNDIRKRPFATKPADYTAADFATPQELINRILLERVKELVFEGHTRYDLIRTDEPLRDFTLTSEKMILPIPDYDVKISYGAILQNRGFR